MGIGRSRSRIIINLGSKVVDRAYFRVPYSGLYSCVQIFVTGWRWPSELIFVVQKFVANDARTRTRTRNEL